MKEIINLGFCPACKSDLEGMMTQTVSNVVFCHLCSFDIQENHEVRRWVSWAKEYKKEMLDG